MRYKMWTSDWHKKLNNVNIKMKQSRTECEYDYRKDAYNVNTWLSHKKSTVWTSNSHKHVPYENIWRTEWDTECEHLIGTKSGIISFRQWVLIWNHPNYRALSNSVLKKNLLSRMVIFHPSLLHFLYIHKTATNPTRLWTSTWLQNKS